MRILLKRRESFFPLRRAYRKKPLYTASPLFCCLIPHVLLCPKRQKENNFLKITKHKDSFAASGSLFHCQISSAETALLLKLGHWYFSGEIWLLDSLFFPLQNLNLHWGRDWNLNASLPNILPTVLLTRLQGPHLSSLRTENIYIFLLFFS